MHEERCYADLKSEGDVGAQVLHGKNFFGSGYRDAERPSEIETRPLHYQATVVNC